MSTHQRGTSSSASEEAGRGAPVHRNPNLLLWAKIAGAAVLWVELYRVNRPFWDRLFGSALGLDLNSHLGGALHFFFYDTIKILLLLTGLMFCIGMLRADGPVPTLQERVDAAVGEATDIFSKIWKWVILGVGIGAAIHGWVPADFFARYAGADNPLAVPLATVLGVPLYANGGGSGAHRNGGGVVPIGEALWSKGMPLGTVMSLMMGAIARSIPEGIMLRRVMKPQLLALFFGSVTVGIIVVGYLFNILYA